MFGESETRKNKSCYRRAIHHWITIDLRKMKQNVTRWTFIFFQIVELLLSKFGYDISN